MSIQFVLGPSGSGKSTAVLNKIIQESMEHPDTMFFLVVPEQYTMEAQRDIVTIHPKGGTMNIDAIGFNRLAYRIFDELGLSTGQVLFDFGKSMLIKKILWENRDKLKVYKGCIDKMGFIDEMKSMMSELFQYGIKQTDIEEVMCALDEQSLVYQKLADMQLVYEEFEAFTGEAYIVAEQLTEMLTSHAAESDILKNSYLYFDGFTGFTPVQMQLICELMKCTKGIVFSFTLGREAVSFSKIKEHELFYLTKTTVKALTDMAAKEHIEILDSVVLKQKIPYRFEKNLELACLEQNLFRFPYAAYTDSLHNISITEAENIHEELRFVAETIRSLVKNQGYRYKEIAIVAGDLKESSHDFLQIMEEFQIPVFIDTNSILKANPCSETIRSLIGIFRENFSYDSVFRFLKAGMTDLSQEQIEYLETYALKKGLRGYAAWNREIPEICEVNGTVSIESARHDFMELLVDISPVFRDKKSTVKDYVTALYQFLLKMHMFEKLAMKKQEFFERQQMDEGNAYGQIFSKIVALFDKMIELLGEEHMDSKEFYEILDTGLSEIEIGTVPPTVDRVLVGDITRSRLNHIKVLFLTGVNDGIIPKAAKKGKILGDYDRSALEKHGLVLAPSDKVNAYIEQFYLYTNITKPSEKLYLSYRKVDAGLKACRPSYVINRILNIFPKLQIKEYEPEQQLETVDGVLRYLVRHHGETEQQGIWNTLATLLKEEGHQKELAALAGGLQYSNQVHAIDVETVKLLYGNELMQSVSRLETFAKCNFAYFLKYGLGLKERELYKIDVRNIGNILHQVMEKVFVKVKNTCRNDWENLSDGDRDQMVADALKEAADENAGAFFEEYARNQYMYSMLFRMAKRSVKTLQQHLKLGTMKPGMIEKNFDAKADGVDAYMFQLDSGMEMFLCGKIDRVDVEEDKDTVYMKVVDYKSSSKDLKLDQILSGLQLQLCTYSAVAYEIEKQIYPDKQIRLAGMLYYGFDDPVVEMEQLEIEQDEQGARFVYSEEIEKKRLESLKMKGFVNANPAVIDKMDQTRTTTLPVKLDKEGQPKASDHILPEPALKRLMEITRENIRKLGNQIANGQIDISPVRDGTKTACEYCDFQAICRFDPKYGGNNYKKTEQVPFTWNEEGE